MIPIRIACKEIGALEGGRGRQLTHRWRLASGRKNPAGRAGLAFGGGVGFGVLLQEVEGRGFFGGELGGFRNILDG